MPNSKHKNTDALVLIKKETGVTLIPATTPLTRLNYFDGKFLRAADLQTEQRYLRRLVQLSNQADGAGVVHGFDVSLGGGDTLNIGPGMALDPAGRVLLLPQDAAVNVQELIEHSQRAALQPTASLKAKDVGFEDCLIAGEAPPTGIPRGGDLYLITIAHAEAFCGEEDVYGKLCEEACLTSTDRPYLIEGVVIRAVPLQLVTLLPTSSAVALSRKHLRSRVASAYFQDERNRVGSLISKAGLASDAWCFGAELAGGNEVPIAVVARAGTNTVFLDAWIARREIIETPAKRYWQWRMAMRPWDVFLAHVLQFQCQLHDLFKKVAEPGGVDDPCDEAHKLIAEATDTMAELLKFYQTVSGELAKAPGLAGNLPSNALIVNGGIAKAGDLHKKFAEAKQTYQLIPTNRLLINGGIVELPSAGYLPVTPGATVTINKQVRMMMGEGVDLRFCIVRPDYVAHALEAAQHMERISLLEGLDNPEKKPQVDILVPNGEVVEIKTASGSGYEAAINFLPDFITLLIEVVAPWVLEMDLIRNMNIAALFNGAARSEVLPNGGRAFHAALLLTELPLQASTVTTFNVVTTAMKGAFNAGEGSAEDEETTDTTGTTSTAKRLFTRLLNTAIIKSRARAAEKAAASESAGAEEVAGDADAKAPSGAKFAKAIPTFSAGQPQGIQTIPAGIWVTVSSNKDIIKLQPGESVQIDARAVIAGIIPTLNIPGTQPVTNVPVYFDGRLQATITVDQITPGAGGSSSLKCRVSVYGSFFTKFWQSKDADASNANFDVTIEVGGTGGPAKSISIKVDNPDGEGGALFKAEWVDQPFEFKATILSVYEENEEKVFETSFVKNPEVFEANNTNHTQALSGLQVAGDALNDSTFLKVASGLLFPSLPPSTEGLTVRGTTDWVLFHRRRTKKCGVEVLPPPPAPPRRYQVYHVEYNERFFPLVRKALQSNDTVVLSRFIFTKVDIVEFGAGVTTLNTNVNSIKSDWQSVNPGNQIVYGAIASAGAAASEGSAIASGRLTQMEGAVSSISPTDASSIAEVLTAVPTPLAVPNTDGVIVLFTKKEVATVCHGVYMVQSPGLFDEIKAILPTGLDFNQLLMRLKAESIGDVLFESGTSDVVTGSPSSLDVVVQVWNGKNFGDIFGRFVLSHTTDTTAERDVHKQQAEKILQAIGQGTGVVRDEATTSLEFPGGCVAVTFMARG